MKVESLHIAGVRVVSAQQSNVLAFAFPDSGLDHDFVRHAADARTPCNLGSTAESCLERLSIHQARETDIVFRALDAV
jgi:hypothetical protein